MDLDLLAESESDSESSHSNPDNASVQRSAVTAATAGSDAGWYSWKLMMQLVALLYISWQPLFESLYFEETCHHYHLYGA